MSAVDLLVRDVILQTVFSHGQSSAIMLLVGAGIISIIAILIASILVIRLKTYHKTHLVAYCLCLLIANILQSIGTIMNVRWISRGGVFEGSYCSAQGGIKNAGNVGTALWSFMIAVHIFNFLFLRWRTTRIGFCITFICGWAMVVTVVVLGPTVIETPEKGPYFGVSGYWCWITDNYPKEQTSLEYLFEFLSAGLGFVLYTLVLLRLRGNLTNIDGYWRLRWVARGKSWKLSLGRDMIDHAMLRSVSGAIWFPVAYSVIIVPIALARLSSFSGHKVPFWATITTDVIFNLTGLVNAIFYTTIRSTLPNTSELPVFSTPRRVERGHANSGITPFVLPSMDAPDLDKDNRSLHTENEEDPDKSEMEKEGDSNSDNTGGEIPEMPTLTREATNDSSASVMTFESADSTSPLRRPPNLSR